MCTSIYKYTNLYTKMYINIQISLKINKYKSINNYIQIFKTSIYMQIISYKYLYTNTYIKKYKYKTILTNHIKKRVKCLKDFAKKISYFTI